MPCSYKPAKYDLTHHSLLLVQLRKDKYNPKIRKYFVVHGEEDDEVSEEEEKREQQDIGEAT